MHVEGSEAVSADFDGIVFAEILELDLLVRGEDDGAVGDCVGTDGSDDNGVDGWVDDGAACCKRVSGGAVWGGYDDAIGFKGVEVEAVDVDANFDEAGVFAAMDDDVVDGKALIAAEALAVNDGSFFNHVMA